MNLVRLSVMYKTSSKSNCCTMYLLFTKYYDEMNKLLGAKLNTRNPARPDAELEKRYRVEYPAVCRISSHRCTVRPVPDFVIRPDTGYPVHLYKTKTGSIKQSLISRIERLL